MNYDDAYALDDEKTIRYFTERIDEHGIDVLTVDWGRSSSQELRFRLLSEIADLRRSKILDVGCGLGDFYGWLKRNGFNVTYTGIDITPRMIDLARSRFPDAEFKTTNVIKNDDIAGNSFDFAFASGIFYLRRTRPEDFLEEMVHRLFNKCRIGIAFNSLSGWATKKCKDEFYANPLEVVDYCRKITPWVTLRHDYHESDFTVYMYKERSPESMEQTPRESSA